MFSRFSDSQYLTSGSSLADLASEYSTLGDSEDANEYSPQYPNGKKTSYGYIWVLHHASKVYNSEIIWALNVVRSGILHSFMFCASFSRATNVCNSDCIVWVRSESKRSIRSDY